MAGRLTPCDVEAITVKTACNMAVNTRVTCRVLHEKGKISELTVLFSLYIGGFDVIK